jgi:hypothetical protein
MVLAVLFIAAMVALLAWPASVYLWYDLRGAPIPQGRRLAIAACLLAAAALCVLTFVLPMRRGVRALEELG